MNNICLSDINNKLDYIIQKIDLLEKKINSIENNLNNIDKKTEKIDTHIDFGLQVYNTIKTPLNFFTDKINQYIGSKVTKLPELNYNNMNNNMNDNIDDVD